MGEGTDRLADFSALTTESLLPNYWIISQVQIRLNQKKHRTGTIKPFLYNKPTRK